MPSDQSAVSVLIQEVLSDPDLAHDDVFRRLLQAGLQDLIDAEATAQIGAEPYERSSTRSNRRNGKRPKKLATTAGEVDLAIPKLRQGSFFPSLLSPRKRVDKALYAVICSAWIEGVSTRKVDDLVRALGNESGISRSTVSRICKDIDEAVGEFLTRPLDHTWFLRVRRRHLRGCQGQPPSGLSGPGGRHRGLGPGTSRDPGYGTRRR